MYIDYDIFCVWILALTCVSGFLRSQLICFAIDKRFAIELRLTSPSVSGVSVCVCSRARARVCGEGRGGSVDCKYRLVVVSQFVLDNTKQL